MSCSGLQTGGAKYSQEDLVPGPKLPQGGFKQMSNGAKAGYVNVGGKLKWVIVSGSTKGHRRPPHPITREQAQKSFKRYYETGRMPVYRRGPRAGSAVYKSPATRARAMGMDAAYTSPKRVIADSRYLGRAGPRRWEFEGVDTGAGVRKPPTDKQLAARAAFAAAAKARARVQAGGKGTGCHLSPKKRCAGYDGPDDDGCVRNGASGRCIQEKALQKRWNVKRQMSPSLVKAHAARAANVAARRAAKAAAAPVAQAGGYWW